MDNQVLNLPKKEQVTDGGNWKTPWRPRKSIKLTAEQPQLTWRMSNMSAGLLNEPSCRTFLKLRPFIQRSSFEPG